jgi:hypothetical protein
MKLRLFKKMFFMRIENSIQHLLGAVFCIYDLALTTISYQDISRYLYNKT